MASESASRSSSAGDSYIGSLISLTSKSEIRYEGVLYNINTEESSIGLRNVRSFGTEGRKQDGPQIPPSDKVYEYILFRGSDIKDLQVKSSPPVQPTPPINNDPAIIQSHYARPVTTSTSLPSAASGTLTDISSHSTQLGLSGSNFQAPLSLYQPRGNIGSWGPSLPAPTANGSGLAMPMYWQGYYGAPSGLPHLHQQSLFRPPPGLPMPPSLQQPMQYPNFSPSLPTGSSNLLEIPSPLVPVSSSSPSVTSASLPPPGLLMPPSLQQPMQYPNFSPSLPTGSSNLLEIPSPFVPASSSSPSVTSASLPPSNLPSHLPPAPSATLASEIMPVSVPNKVPTVLLPVATLAANLPSLNPLTTSSPDINVIVPSISNKPNVIAGSNLPYQTVSQSIPTIVGSSNSVLTETPAPSLVTPGQLLQSGPAIVSLSQPSQTSHKDVEVVQVSSTSSPEQSMPVSAEAQSPILPLPATSRPSHRPNGAPVHTQHGYGYWGNGRGRGIGISRPITKFTEDFDFKAMNENFNKDEVWGHLGKSNKSQSKGKDGEENVSGDDIQNEDDGELSKFEVKTVYNKDDFFDTLSCNANDYDPQNGRTRYSEQIKIDTETFGDFMRHRGGRAGRGPGRSGHSRGGYYGRGYGYSGRGRGRGMSSRTY